MATSDDPEAMLAEVRRTKAVTHTALRTAGWGPLALWGVICLGGSLVAMAPSAVLVAAYWTVAATVGAWYSAATGRRAARTARIGPPSEAPRVIGLLIFVGSFGSWIVLDIRPAALAWWAIATGGMALIALLERQRVLAAALVVIGIWGVVMWFAIDDDMIIVIMTSALGALLLGAGVALRMARPDGGTS